MSIDWKAFNKNRHNEKHLVNICKNVKYTMTVLLFAIYICEI